VVSERILAAEEESCMFSVVGLVEILNPVFWVDIISGVVTAVVECALLVADPLVTRTLGTKNKSLSY
jgi:uncharacterized membrane protein